jgi:hypothetical protein
MHFNCREWNGFDDVVKRNAGEAEPGWIDDCSVDIVDMMLKRVYQHALMIRLEDDDFDTKFGSYDPDSFINE